jgi:ankyrin repeat protein
MSYNRWTGWSLLHRAAETGQTDICQILIEQGANVNSKTIRGWFSPLHLALSAGYIETAKLLVSYYISIYDLS